MKNLGKSSGVTTRQQKSSAAQKGGDSSSSSKAEQMEKSDGDTVPVNQEPIKSQEDATGKPKTEFQELIDEIKERITNLYDSLL